MLYVDALAAEIRRVDGSNSLGAGALAEALMPFIMREAADMCAAAYMNQTGADPRYVTAIRALAKGTEERASHG